MKKLLITSAALSALALSAPAFAQDEADSNTGTQSAQIVISATNPAKCDLSASSNAVSLSNNSITDANGFAYTDIGERVAAALNQLTVNAWCTGGTNKLNLSRTSLSLDGTGAGVGTDGFARAVIYDLEMKVAGAQRADQSAPPANEGTSDGEGFGPGTVGSSALGRFGATGVGSAITFNNEAANATSAAVTDANGSAGPRSTFATDNSRRLVAGSYSSVVKITLTPGT